MIVMHRVIWHTVNRSSHRYHPCANSGVAKMNTRCPPKRVMSAARFFTLCRLTVQPPQSYSIGGQRSSGQLTGKAAGARPDYRGCWCASEKEVVKDIINIVMDEELLHTVFDPEETEDEELSASVCVSASDESEPDVYFIKELEDEVVREIVTLVTTGNKQTETNRPFEGPSNTGAGSEATPSDSTSQVAAA
ncbi:UNVERIFIED_CONTAM: hypothetical protein FKN15_003302 [Acipenser sinensis]